MWHKVHCKYCKDKGYLLSSSKNTCLSSFLAISGGRIYGFMSFSGSFVLREKKNSRLKLKLESAEISDDVNWENLGQNNPENNCNRESYSILQISWTKASLVKYHNQISAVFVRGRKSLQSKNKPFLNPSWLCGEKEKKHNCVVSLGSYASIYDRLRKKLCNSLDSLSLRFFGLLSSSLLLFP